MRILPGYMRDEDKQKENADCASGDRARWYKRMCISVAYGSKSVRAWGIS